MEFSHVIVPHVILHLADQSFNAEFPHVTVQFPNVVVTLWNGQ